jgi:type II secretory pathway predicted ATPase ExeA
MYLKYFNLTEEPFGVTPDSRFLFLGRHHREAMASLAYGTESNRGFLALIAKPGMGKTTLLYHYLEWLRGRARTAYVFRTDCDSREFIRHILLDLGVDTSSNDLPAMHDKLNKILIEEMNRGRRFVLVIDEAQNLDEQTLESVRLLSNFETPWKKLMQIVIAGQPGLAEKLARPSMAQLRQRISMVMRLEPFNHEETSAYIDHRLSIAGCQEPRLFTAGARAAIAEFSEGIPRNINNICFNAMSLACGSRRTAIDRKMVSEVLADLDIETLCDKQADLQQPATSGVSAAPTPGSAERKRSSVPRTWIPRMVGTGVAALALCCSVGGSQQETQRTIQVDRAVASSALARDTASPVSVEKPIISHKKVSAITLRGEPSQRISKTVRAVSDQISTMGDLQAIFDVHKPMRTATSAAGISEDLPRSIGPHPKSPSEEAESDE